MCNELFVMAHSGAGTSGSYSYFMDDDPEKEAGRKCLFLRVL